MSETSELLILASIFVAVVAFVYGAYLLWRGINLPGKMKTSKRLQQLYASGVSREEALSLLRTEILSSSSILDAIYKEVPRLVNMHRLIEQAGIHLSLTRFMLIQIVLSAAFIFFLSRFTAVDQMLSILLGLVLGLYLPYWYIRHRCDVRREMFKTQLPDALDFIARSLRAGNPFNAAIKQVGKEMPEPISDEFAITFDEINFGLEFELAMHGLYERTQSEEIRYFVTAVILQRSTGGNLAEILNRISAIIRSRASTQKEIRILSAEMRQSAMVLFMLPIFVAGAIMVINPGYLGVLLESDAGTLVIGAQIFFMILGYIIVRRMVSFRV